MVPGTEWGSEAEGSNPLCKVLRPWCSPNNDFSTESKDTIKKILSEKTRLGPGRTLLCVSTCARTHTHTRWGWG